MQAGKKSREVSKQLRDIILEVNNSNVLTQLTVIRGKCKKKASKLNYAFTDSGRNLLGSVTDMEINISARCLWDLRIRKAFQP